MKYNISINQKAVIDLKLDLDLQDLAIFDLFSISVNSNSSIRKIYDNKIYILFNYKFIIKEIPLLKIKSRQGISKKINNLIESGLIERCPENQTSGSAYFGVGRNFDLMFFDKNIGDNKSLQGATEVTGGDNKSLQGCKQEVTGGDNKSLHYNYTIDNYTINNSSSLEKESDKEEEALKSFNEKNISDKKENQIEKKSEAPAKKKMNFREFNNFITDLCKEKSLEVCEVKLKDIFEDYQSGSVNESYIQGMIKNENNHWKILKKKEKPSEEPVKAKVVKSERKELLKEEKIFIYNVIINLCNCEKKKVDFIYKILCEEVIAERRNAKTVEQIRYYLLDNYPDSLKEEYKKVS